MVVDMRRLLGRGAAALAVGSHLQHTPDWAGPQSAGEGLTSSLSPWHRGWGGATSSYPTCWCMAVPTPSTGVENDLDNRYPLAWLPSRSMNGSTRRPRILKNVSFDPLRLFVDGATVVAEPGAEDLVFLLQGDQNGDHHDIVAGGFPG